MRKSAEQQVEEIEMARFEIYMTLFLLELGIELNQNKDEERRNKTTSRRT